MKNTKTEEQRSGVDVLPLMVVTFAVSHLERSELNADARLNAVEVNAMVDPIQNKSRRRTKKWGRVRKQNSKEETTNGRTKKCSGRTV